MTEKVGDNFQQQTKYIRGKKLGTYLDWSTKPKTYKDYPEHKKVKIPLPKNIKTSSFGETIKNRKSTREFSDKTLILEQLSYLLWATTGLQRIENGYEFRTTPSAGALYPIETYLFARNLEKIDTGLYHYNIKSHLLEELKIGDFSYYLAKACLGQKMLATAQVVFIWSAIFEYLKDQNGNTTKEPTDTSI
jgi:hypothetical protein